ncbi:hypothetical protein NGIG_00367 [Neisseria gonorrhoeae PID24-1]|nr:predicted protein [Neisseria gonorrhoeae F62]KMY06018.1 hypothetical protein NGIG_00367 [Neisseria gonorrhoeae PID24-1]
MAAALVQQAAAFVGGIVGRSGKADRTERQEKQAEAVGHGMGSFGQGGRLKEVKTEIPQGNAGLHGTSETGQPQYIYAYCGCG